MRVTERTASIPTRSAEDLITSRWTSQAGWPESDGRHIQPSAEATPRTVTGRISMAMPAHGRPSAGHFFPGLAVLHQETVIRLSP